MSDNFTEASPLSGADIPHEFQKVRRRKGLRSHLPLGFLLLSAAFSYAVVFVLIDMWYKGGSLGIL